VLALGLSEVVQEVSGADDFNGHIILDCCEGFVAHDYVISLHGYGAFDEFIIFRVFIHNM
jgi:hypothetical protein